MILYYVEVMGASALAPHRICAVYISPDLINPPAQRYLSFHLWEDKKISTIGEITSAVPCTGFRVKTIYLVSKYEGNVHVQVDPAGLNQ